MNVLNGNRGRFSWSRRIVRCRNRRHFQKAVESGRRERQKIVVFIVAGITEPMWNIAWRHEGIARLENEDLVSDGDLKLSGEDKIRFILTRVGMPRHAHPRRETNLQETISSSCIRT